MDTPNRYAEIIACLFNGVNPADYSLHKAASEQLNDTQYSDYGFLGKVASRIGAGYYEEAGLAGSVEHLLYVGLIKAGTWYPEFDKFTAPVLNALGRELAAAQRLEKDQDDRVKMAGVAAMALNLLGKGVATAPAMAKLVMGTGAAVGAGVGAIGWGLNRHANEDDANIEAMKQKMKHYRRITSEISDDLRRNNALDANDAQGIIADDAGTNHITS